MHSIEDELVFATHKGYIFHDSRGFECGSQDEVDIVQDFVRRKSREKRLKDRLHAIWYCIPMDNDRPELDSKHFDKICPDKNVPVIAVFTKYDQFKRDIKMKLEDENRETELDAEVEKIFNQHYLASLGGDPPFVRLERMHKPGQRCTDLIEMTANALSGDVVALMFIVVQKDNLELSITYAIKWVHARFMQGTGSTEAVIKACVMAFPSIWPIKRKLKLNEDFPEPLLMGNWWSLLEFFSEEFNKVLSKLQTFVANSPLCISNNDPHHTMIVIILILEYGSLSKKNSNEALDKAYFQYISSNTHNAVQECFLASPNQYSILQFTEFILKHRL